MQSQKPEPSPQPSTSLQGEQTGMSGLDMVHWKFAITPKDKFQDQWRMIQQLWYAQVNNQQTKAWTKSLKYILDQSMQLIEADKYEEK